MKQFWRDAKGAFIIILFFSLEKRASFKQNRRANCIIYSLKSLYSSNGHMTATHVGVIWLKFDIQILRVSNHTQVCGCVEELVWDHIFPSSHIVFKRWLQTSISFHYMGLIQKDGLLSTNHFVGFRRHTYLKKIVIFSLFWGMCASFEATRIFMDRRQSQLGSNLACESSLARKKILRL